MKSKGEILRVDHLSADQKESMYKLFCRHFNNTDRDAFNKDLHEKEWVILIKDIIYNQIQGFSTQTILEINIDGVLIKAIFSGDTIIHKDYWGERELIRTWGKFAFWLIEKYTGVELYWFLISMGYRTYRFLPTFFKEFYPCYNKLTPVFEERIIDGFACSKYPLEYDSKSGVVRPATRTPLKSGISDVSSNLLNDPHISFFVHKNSDYFKGDELACIAKLSKDNFKPIAYKILPLDESILLHL